MGQEPIALGVTRSKVRVIEAKDKFESLAEYPRPSLDRAAFQVCLIALLDLSL